MKRAAWLAAGAVLALAAGATALLPRVPPAAPQLGDERIARLVAACTEDMVRRTCRVMGAPDGARVADGTVIFVAGVGAIDASAYNELRAAGDAMCQSVRRACTSQPDGAACKTAQALYART